MEAEEFIKKELRLCVIISNLQCNLTYGAIVALLKKYDYYKALEQSTVSGSDSDPQPDRTL
jgi:hypothetical protein